ncbi:hypothetical protein B9W68_01465 [Streptomyces sp. CS227]|uniref:hypothetical protein n=1 Tax=Streptomyces sp. CS227 TaxID=1982763 RepID=UPI000B40B564|nr:hypothetical protein [Streptomyces sp. CS227]OWA19196.1 hypothetical protein B9W68_01465 [Streptomyces sp. CS227]
MGKSEFSATGVGIMRRLRSLTRAGQVRVADGRLALLTSCGRVIDSAPAREVRVERPWFGSDDQAVIAFNDTRYRLRLGGPAAAASASHVSPVRRLREAVGQAQGVG